MQARFWALGPAIRAKRQNVLNLNAPPQLMRAGSQGRQGIGNGKQEAFENYYFPGRGL